MSKEPGPVQKDPEEFLLPRYWVEVSTARERWHGNNGWAIGWRDIGPKERTLLATVVPDYACGDTLPLMRFPGETVRKAPAFLALLSSFLVDYLARARTDKGRMSYFIIKQLPFPEPSQLDVPCPWNPSVATGNWLTHRALELTYTFSHLEAFGTAFGIPAPFRWFEVSTAAEN